jgi:hypothetical protein
LKQTASLEELRNQVTESNAKNIEANRTAIETNKAMIVKLEEGKASLDLRMSGAEENIANLTADNQKLTQRQTEMREHQDGVIWRACQSLQTLVHANERKTSDLQAEVEELHSRGDGFQALASTKFQLLFDDGNQFKEQLKFLMEATEMLKRKARESNKSHTNQFQELSDSEGKLRDHLASLERSLKAHERDVRALEKNVVKRFANLGGGPLPLAAEPPPPTDPKPFDSNQHLHGVLAQLEKIASASPQKLPRPGGDDFMSAEDAAQMHGLPPALTGLATLGATRTQGVYGLSPRLPLPGMKAPPVPAAPAGGNTGLGRSAAQRKTPRSS